MQTIQLDVSSDIYDKVMAFLEILPKDKVKLSIPNAKKPFNPKDFFDVADSSKEEIDKYLKQNSNEWDSYLDEK